MAADPADAYVDDAEVELHAATLRLVAHDINNPLTAIRILAEMLRDDVRQEHRQDLADILEAADLATALVSAISESRAGSEDEYTWFPIDLVQLLRSVVDRPALRRHVSLSLPSELQIGGDMTALRRAFTDVLVNARRMNDQRSTVDVEVEDRGSTIDVRVFVPPPASIPSPMRHLLFQRHGVVALRRNRVPVSAVGLVDAHAIFLGHGGAIRVDEGASGGLILVVTLPR